MAETVVRPGHHRVVRIRRRGDDTEAAIRNRRHGEVGRAAGVHPRRRAILDDQLRVRGVADGLAYQAGGRQDGGIVEGSERAG